MRAWIAREVDTWRTARAEGMPYWQLRRIRRLTRKWVAFHTRERS